MTKSLIVKRIEDALYENELSMYYKQDGADFVVGTRAFVARLYRTDLTKFKWNVETCEAAIQMLDKLSEIKPSVPGMVLPSKSQLKRIINAKKDRSLVKYYFNATLSYNARIMLAVMKLLGECKGEFVCVTGYTCGRDKLTVDVQGLRITSDRGEALIMPFKA